MDYSKYHFNYFDVIKRHERIINRPKDWEVKVLAIIMLMVTFIYTFTNFGFCSEEEQQTISYTTYTDRHIVSATGVIEEGYVEPLYVYNISNGGIYTIHNRGSVAHTIWKGSSVAVGSTLTYLGRINNTNDDISVQVNSGDVLFLVASGGNSNTYDVYFEPLGMNQSVNGLVDSVGVNQIWGVFENGVSFVGVVVLVAFGLFLVVLAIKKVSKGKSEF